MSPINIEKLRKYLPFWEYYQTNKCIPPINLPTLEAIAVIYKEELHPAPVRLYCSVCVEEMITTLFNQYERELKQINLSAEPTQTIDDHDNKSNNNKETIRSGKSEHIKINPGKNRVKRRKIKRRNKK